MGHTIDVFRCYLAAPFGLLVTRIRVEQRDGGTRLLLRLAGRRALAEIRLAPVGRRLSLIGLLRRRKVHQKKQNHGDAGSHQYVQRF